MSTADKLTTIAENQQRVYDAGYEKGETAGAKSAYDLFWDSFQANGIARNYYYAFAYTNWNDTTYNPKYDIIGSTSGSSLRSLFYSSGVTDTKVAIDASKTTSIQGIFYWARSLVTVRNLKLGTKVTDTKSAFTDCTQLKNLTVEGDILSNFDLSYSPLTPESMKSVISCLKKYAGTSNEFAYTVSFTGACWAALEADSTAPDGGTWADYVEKLGWLT